MNRLRQGTIALLCGLLFTALAGAGEETADSEIRYLLDYVAGSGCVFLRNGDSHDASDAADHWSAIVPVALSGVAVSVGAVGAVLDGSRLLR